MIRSRDMESFNGKILYLMELYIGLMDESMKDSGKMVNSMVKVFTLILKGEEKRASGMKERELDGLIKLKLLNDLINFKD